jgi:hypothetical protein
MSIRPMPCGPAMEFSLLMISSGLSGVPFSATGSPA